MWFRSLLSDSPAPRTRIVAGEIAVRSAWSERLFGLLSSTATLGCGDLKEQEDFLSARARRDLGRPRLGHPHEPQAPRAIGQAPPYQTSAQFCSTIIPLY